MAKQAIPFSAFAEAAGPAHAGFIGTLHKELTDKNYITEIKQAAQGYVVSYVHRPTKRTIANYVFRKKGLLLRVYADNVISYMETLTSWPDSMKEAVKKAGPCKRLLNPADCNPRCPTGYDFILDDERQQKCRYNGFLLSLTDETKPYLLEMVRCEIKARQSVSA